MALKKHKLGELCEIKRGMSLSGEYYATEGKLIRLTLGNFDYQNNSFKLNTSKDNLYFNGDVPAQFIMKKGDIITPLTEQTAGLLGSTAKIPESDLYIQSQDVAKIVCNEKINPDFAFYLISSSIVKNQLSAGAQQTKIRHTSPDKIKDCVVFIPSSVEEQKRIAKVLTDIDSKIALNKKINKELETMAKEIYDYWFVQFDFPDAQGKPYKSSGGKMVYNPLLKREIPEGWEVKSVFDAFDVQYGFPFNTDLFTEKKTNIPIVRIRDILENSVSAYSREETDEKYHLYKKDLLIGMDGNFHMNYWSDDEAYLNQRSVRLRKNNSYNISTIQGYYELQPIIKAKELRAKGSTVGHLSDKDMKELNILIPVANDYFNPTKQFEIILDKKMLCMNEIKTLTNIRDELLPLLMNGQVSVKE